MGSRGLQAWPETGSWCELILVLERARLVWTSLAAYLTEWTWSLVYHRNFQLKLSRQPPFLSKSGKRGGLWTCPKSEAHALGCRPWGESSHWSSNSPQTYRIVPAWVNQWNSEEMEAMWDCASQLWVPGRSRVHVCPYLSFCRITLQHFSLRSWWVCRWMPIW